MGELLAALPKSKGERTDATSFTGRTRLQEATDQLDIGRTTAAKYQAIASLSDEDTEGYFARKAKEEEG